MADDPAALPEGTMVGAYRVMYRLGGGGMGVVYAAEEPTIHKRVAIKVLHLSLAADPALAARFEREARAANDVRHPAVIDVFAIGKLEDGRPYLVMSLLEGRSLAEEIASRGRIPMAEAWEWLRELAGALGAAHEAGIIHRDLKPDNVFVERVPGKPPRVRLLDLGLAKIVPTGDEPLDPGDAVKLSQTGAPMGTPIYMAPEQWWGQDVDDRVDQYALGVTAFEMLTGAPPFPSRQYIELAQQHMHSRVPSLSSAGCEAPPAVDALFARALAKSPDDRFASMAALVEAGDAAFSFDGASAPTTDATLVAPASVAAAVSLSLVETPPAIARAAAFGTFVWVHLALVVLGAAGMVAVGYAGEMKHAPAEWIHAGGMSSILVATLFVVCIPGYLLLASRRTQGAGGAVGWWLALAIAVLGVTGSYFGMVKSASAVAKLDSPRRFVFLELGTFESESARFLGLSLAALLFASLAASAGLSRPRAPTETLSAPLGISGRESVVGAVGLCFLAGVAVAFGAPSAAATAVLAAFLVALGALLPPLDRATAAKDEIERAGAGLIALGLLFLGSITRIEARYAALWSEQLTRAERAVEVVDVAHEKTTTLSFGAASLVVLIAIEVIRLRRITAKTGKVGFTLRMGALAAVFLAAASIDVIEQRGFGETRDAVRADLDAQFSLFAELDPPSSDALDDRLHTPHSAPALQLTRSLVAINGKGVAPLSAATSADGAINIGHDLSHAVAEHAALARAAEPTVDLAIAIDRRTVWRDVERVLGIARRAGVRRIEILLTRGPGPHVPEGAPPEANWVLASDFAAIGAELGDAGFSSPDPSSTFGELAPELVRRSLAESGPVAISAPAN